MAAPKGNKYALGCTTNGSPEKYTSEWGDAEAKILLAWIKDETNDPNKKIYLGSFALERGYHRARFQEFKEKSKDFANAYETAKVWQEQKFITNALTRKWDPGFTARVMARVCGDEWKNSWDREEEKSEQAPTIIINKISS
jgi:hypothetical protein